MSVFYVKCLGCNYKFPYNSYDSKAVEALMENLCKNCGKLTIVDEAAYLFVKSPLLNYHQNIIINKDDSVTTEFKRVELKTEFLKNKWRW